MPEPSTAGILGEVEAVENFADPWQSVHRVPRKNVANGIGFGNHTAYRSIVVPFWCNQYDFSDPVELAYRTGPQENILPTPAGPVIKTL